MLKGRAVDHAVVLWDFRVWGQLGRTVKIESPASELVLADESQVRVILRSREDGVPLADSREILLHGTGYVSEQDAKRDGEQWWDQLMLALAVVGIGADFGARWPRGEIDPQALAQLEQEVPNTQIHAWKAGVQTFPAEPPAAFMRIDAEGVAGHFGYEVEQAIRQARAQVLGLTEKERLAFDLFSASFSEQVADARLLMLSMALEALIDQEDRGPDAQALINDLVARTKQADLSVDKHSLLKSLEGLRTQSVSQAGRRLAKQLGTRRYDGQRPADFFQKMYKVRSALVHADGPRPSREEVDLLAAHAQRFVGDLIGHALLAAQ